MGEVFFLQQCLKNVKKNEMVSSILRSRAQLPAKKKIKKLSLVLNWAHLFTHMLDQVTTWHEASWLSGRWRGRKTAQLKLPDSFFLLCGANSQWRDVLNYWKQKRMPPLPLQPRAPLTSPTRLLRTTKSQLCAVWLLRYKVRRRTVARGRTEG